MHSDELYIKRCFELARLGEGAASPNPAVGAILVHQDRIIGEGYHKIYGHDHAEVDAFNSVKPEHLNLVPHSTLYVSLEPCCIFGNTPPCTSLIIKNKIKKVIISALDSTPGVAGKGVQILKNAGVEVKINILKEQGEALFKPRNIFVENQRPYIVLKYAKTANEQFCPIDNEQFWITNSYTKRLVHKWRSEVDAIMIGTQTALIDDPQLTNRYYHGKSPIRVVLDRKLKIPGTAKILNSEVKTLIITEFKEASHQNLEYIRLDFNSNVLPPLLQELHKRKIGSLLVEGGVQLLNSFIKAKLWDEARVFTGKKFLERGKPAPSLPVESKNTHIIDDNRLDYYYNDC